MTVEPGKSFSELVQTAEQAIRFTSVQDARALQLSGGCAFIDLRLLREMEKTGIIAGATSCPRGMLEFWLDPTSPYAREIFTQPLRFVFYCDNGWRSALSTQLAQDMGLQDVTCLQGGLDAWLAADGPVEPYRW